MNMKSQNKLLPAILAALVMTAGSALAAAPEKDPGQQQPTSAQPTSAQPTSEQPSSSMQQQATPATTASISPAAYEKFDAIDVDHDGSIDKKESEASKTLSAQFSKLDTNKDGKLSVTEFNNASNMASIKVDKKAPGY